MDGCQRWWEGLRWINHVSRGCGVVAAIASHQASNFDTGRSKSRRQPGAAASEPAESPVQAGITFAKPVVAYPQHENRDLRVSCTSFGLMMLCYLGGWGGGETPPPHPHPPHSGHLQPTVLCTFQVDMWWPTIPSLAKFWDLPDILLACGARCQAMPLTSPAGVRGGERVWCREVVRDCQLQSSQLWRDRVGIQSCD